MASKYYVTNFYRFIAISSPADLRVDLKSLGKEHALAALVILAPEGINGTIVSGSAEGRELVKTWLIQHVGLAAGDFKDSLSDRLPLRQFKVKLRREIVTLHTPDLVPTEPNDPSYLSPAEWNAWLKSGKEFALVDSRNHYEFRIGAFKGAIDPNTRVFTQLPEVLERDERVKKDKPLLMYCTGGIRCEKAVLEMRRRGFKEVYQLHGGILKYLEAFPNDQFEGECFVFDDRVAVDQNLSASKQYSLCPHCGFAADVPVTCERCSYQAKLCADCAQLPVKGQTCSRDCAHHYSLWPDRKLKAPRPNRFAQK